MYMALRRISHWTLWALPASIAVVACLACSDQTSATDLHPEGPPMVEQVRIKELYAIGNVSGLERVVFGFGTHPDATDSDEHPVTTASPTGNKLRIIMDELLRGNNLEEIACRRQIDDDVYGRVPLGATPDDIARCAGPDDVLPARCPASNSHSVCICARDGGCPPITQNDGALIAQGQPVGVLDLDMDGAADTVRFIQGAVGIRCGTNDVPIDLAASYWTPSGDQQRPAQGGFDALGPAVVLVPLGAMPTSADCGLVFSPDVVDKDGNQVCAPPDGDIKAGCTPGDTSTVHFKVAPMTFVVSSVFSATAQSRTADIKIKANVPLDPTTIANVTVTEMDAPYTQFTVAVGTATTAGEITIHWTAAGGLAAMTPYTITVPTTVTDAFHQPAPQPFQVAFTTGAN